MPGLMKTLRHFATGTAAGMGIAGLLLLAGYAGGQGWQPGGASLALSVSLVILLILLGTLAVTVGYGYQFRLRLTEEDYERRSGMIPVLLGVTLAVLSVWLVAAR